MSTNVVGPKIARAPGRRAEAQGLGVVVVLDQLPGPGALVLAGWVVRLDGWWTWASVPESNVALRADLAGRTGDPATSLATLAALPDQATGRIEQWLVTTMDNRQWAYLGHDVRLVTQWLVEDLPWEISAGDAELDGQVAQ